METRKEARGYGMVWSQMETHLGSEPELMPLRLGSRSKMLVRYAMSVGGLQQSNFGTVSQGQGY